MRRAGRMQDILDLSAVNDDEPASDSFFEDFSRYRGTKVGGYPAEIQHGVGLEDFVFQVGSEEKLIGCGRTTALAIFTNHQTASGDFHVSSTDKLTCFLWL